MANKLNKILVANLLVSIAGSANAASFQIQEQNASNLGNSYAGVASEAADASTAFYNSAGLTELDSEAQLVLSGVYINASAEFSPTLITNTIGVPLPNDKAKTVGNSIVPALHASYKINDSWAVGFSVASPFGLKTEYDVGSSVRYSATRSKLTTIDFAPSIAYKFTPELSIGGGLDIVHVEADLDTAGTLGGPDFIQLNSAKRWAYGWHLGFHYRLDDMFKFGFNYRSRLLVHARGTQTTSPSTIDLGLKADVDLPETITLSATFDPNENWTILGDVAWTHWSRLKELGLNLSNNTSVIIPEHYKNVYRVALGTNYRVNNCWTVKLGLAYDESPTVKEYRTARIPDSDRFWASIGVQYRASKDFTIDFGYAHLFFKDSEIKEMAPIRIPGPQTGQRLNGDYCSYANIVGIQLKWNAL